MFFGKNRPISLRKAKRVLRLGINRFYRKRKKFSESMRADLRELDEAIQKKDREAATMVAKRLEGSALFHKTPLQFVVDLVIGIAVAIVVATVVRQMWFEPMVIPSGSMRPTFQEGDKLLVLKDTFGLNVPMKPAHFFFRPKNVERTGVFIFTSEDMDIPDQDTIYFIFPGKKRLIKRMMGKPGDKLYFYGGQLYGLDREGKELTELRDAPWMEGLDHIPFMNFQGKVSGNPYSVTLRQMNLPIAKLEVLPNGKLKGEMLVDAPDFGDVWGMGNYAMARLVNRKGKLALELKHSPSINRLAMGAHPHLNLKTSLIPLDEKHVQTLMSHLYTSRFIVKDGRAYPEMPGDPPPLRLRPSLPDVPNGRYQFYHGIGYKVLWGGMLKELPKDHPIHNHPQTLFNMGISMVTPAAAKPHRYAYYRNGDLYVMGGPLLKKGDPLLDDLSFRDLGPPTRETIEKYGLEIPEKHYLALGDNHANSGDSRIFGFVPEDNIRGTPSFIFWPPGSRWGPPAQKSYPWITFPRIIIWIIAITCGAITFVWRRYKKRKILNRD